MAKAARQGSKTVSYRKIHDEIIVVRAKLVRMVPNAPSPEKKERLVAAIRNLDIARVVLECNQSLSPTDYHPEPWRQLPGMERKFGKSRGRSKKK